MVKNVEVGWLSQKIASEDDSVLLLDTRDCDEFSSGYIRGAVNVFVSGLAFRRLKKGSMGLDCLMCESTDKTKYEAARRSEEMCVVVYDEDSNASSALPEDGLAHILLKKVTRDCKNVAFLEGGFKAFMRQERKLCIVEDAPATAPTSPCKPTKCAPKLVSRPSSLSLQLKRLSLGDSSDQLTTEPATPFSAGDRFQQRHHPVEILPHLFLGDIKIARSRESLANAGITRILNVSRLENCFQSELTYKQIAVDDAPNVNLSEHFPSAFRFIESARVNEERVLVHCQAGMSRSVTVIIAYLMFHMSLSLERAYDFVKARKPNIEPNFSFMGQLLDYERSRSPDSGIDCSLSDGKETEFPLC